MFFCISIRCFRVWFAHQLVFNLFVFCNLNKVRLGQAKLGQVRLGQIQVRIGSGSDRFSIIYVMLGLGQMCTSDHPRSRDVYQRSHYIARCVPGILHIAIAPASWQRNCHRHNHQRSAYRYCTSDLPIAISPVIIPAIFLSLLCQRSFYRYYASDLPIAIIPAIFTSLHSQLF